MAPEAVVRSPCLQPLLRRRRRRKWLRREALGFGGSDEDTAQEDEQTAPSGLTNTRLRTQGSRMVQPPWSLGWGGGWGGAAKGPLARPTRTSGEDPPHPVQTRPQVSTGAPGAHLPRSVAPTASAVRSRALPHVRPASRLVTQQRRAAFLPVEICASSGVWPRMATKKRKTVPVRASCTGQGFMDRCSSRAAVPSTWAAPHCREGGGVGERGSLSFPSAGAPLPPRPCKVTHPHGAPRQRTAPLHQAVGVRVVGAEPLLREGQQGGPRGHGQQRGHAVGQAIPLALEEHGPRGDSGGPHALRTQGQRVSGQGQAHSPLSVRWWRGSVGADAGNHARRLPVPTSNRPGPGSLPTSSSRPPHPQIGPFLLSTEPTEGKQGASPEPLHPTRL